MTTAPKLVIASLVTLAGCYPTPEFDSVPRIEYAAIDQSTEKDAAGNKLVELVTITVTFEDKEGDLGATAAERSDDDFKAQYGGTGNYELVTMTQKSDGSWDERILQGDSVKWMPVLKPDGKSGPINGKLDLNVRRPYARSMVDLQQKYKVRIRDRALHYSNQVETDVITVPGYE
ncbi:hypothetical protein [Dyadobacter sp. CY326]|uniref:hypothetical protein n=1 Tax=Dyadobacter sp. CY326 TaxID=2907300 RepID=UPI001F2E615D|nr:hypothetical protein [Dyadobacter sp. CY326]MCE7063744.1 hypothetical protein [Dyadobacter sp. CY326]